MLTKVEIQNTRVFLRRCKDITGEETVAHALCLQALDREEQALVRQARDAQIAKEAADRASRSKLEATGDQLGSQISDMQARIDATNAAVGE